MSRRTVATAEPRAGTAGRASAPAEARPPTARGKDPPARTFLDVLGEAGAPRPGARAGPAPPARLLPPPQAPVAPIQRLLEASFAADERLDRIIRAAQRGRTFSAGELLALQAEVFRHSQLVEVVTRTTDKVVGGVKQVLGTQV